MPLAYQEKMEGWRGCSILSKKASQECQQKLGLDPPVRGLSALRSMYGQVPEGKMKLHDFHRRKVAAEKISMVTCYDYWSAQLLN